MSTIKTDTWQNVAGTKTYYGAQAWVNFNGTGVVAIRASKNVSSITDNSTGNYTINMTTALADANYCPVSSAQSVSGTGFTIGGLRGATALTTTSYSVVFTQQNAGVTNVADSEIVTSVVFAN